jgi:maleylpyruvate isomerase
VKLRLYNFKLSSSSRRVRIALAWKGVPYEDVAVDLAAGEQHGEVHRARSPRGTVPLLEIEEGGVTRRLAESMAIIEWLEDVSPAPPLLPRDPWLRGRARMLAEIVNSGTQPFQNLATQLHVKELGGDAETWVRRWVGAGLAALEAAAGATAGRYLVGDAPSIADVFLVPQLGHARRFGVDVSALTTLTSVEAALLELPAFKV